jgi:hypothetical protein
METNEFQLHVVDALARLETKVEDLSGNGKPGRVAVLEKSVGKIKKIVYVGTGVVITLSALIHFIFKY